jgi:hypothetical protein
MRFNEILHSKLSHALEFYDIALNKQLESINTS